MKLAQSEIFRVQKEKEIRHQCEYHTRRIVFDAWDRLVEKGEFTSVETSTQSSTSNFAPP